MVHGLKPVDAAMIGNPLSTPIFDILENIRPDIIALGYDQEHAEDRIRTALVERGMDDIEVIRAEGLSDDLDGTRKIIARILHLWSDAVWRDADVHWHRCWSGDRPVS